jgi:hypothetical protein
MRPGTPPAGTVHGHFSTSISPNGWPLGNGVGDLTPEAMEGGSVLNPAMGSVWGHAAHVATIAIAAGTAPSSCLHGDCGTLKGEPESHSGDPPGHSPAPPPLIRSGHPREGRWDGHRSLIDRSLPAQPPPVREGRGRE